MPPYRSALQMTCPPGRTDEAVDHSSRCRQSGGEGQGVLGVLERCEGLLEALAVGVVGAGVDVFARGLVDVWLGKGCGEAYLEEGMLSARGVTEIGRGFGWRTC